MTVFGMAKLNEMATKVCEKRFETKDKILELKKKWDALHPVEGQEATTEAREKHEKEIKYLQDKAEALMTEENNIYEAIIELTNKRKRKLSY